MSVTTKISAKRLEIIKLSLDLFLEYGYEQTKISQIMKAADLSKGGMYHYFSSKEAILDDVIDYALSEELTGFDQLLMCQPTIFDKLALYLTSSALDYSDYLKKFTRFKRNPESSIVTYRIKELTAKRGIPYLETILAFGIQENVLQTDYLDELTTVLYHAGEALFQSVFWLKQSDKETKSAKTTLISHKIAAFNQLFTQTLAVNAHDSQRFHKILIDSLASVPTIKGSGGSS